MGLPPPVRRERMPGGTALDGLDQQDEARPDRLGWREVLHRLTGIDLGLGKELAYEAGLLDRLVGNVRLRRAAIVIPVQTPRPLNRSCAEHQRAT